MKNRLYLTLENGMVFAGSGFGSDENEVLAELVFNTAMTGYLETLTDPAYADQILVQTFPLIGNYGVIPQDFESGKIHLKAYIVKSWCQDPSNFRSEGVLDAFLKAQKIVGLCDIDTRELTKVLREHGSMNAMLAKEPKTDEQSLKKIKAYKPTGLLAAVGRTQKDEVTPENARYHVALWDFGATKSTTEALTERGCKVTRMPHTAKAADILALKADGVVLSDGPGDPAENTALIAEVASLMQAGVPVYGISLGHQLMALAMGGKTAKLHCGHRGGQPVRSVADGHIYTTAQNHGYVVDSAALPKDSTLSFVNVNDNTCEGLIYNKLPAFSSQFYPKSSGSPYDPATLWDSFIALLDKKGVK